MSEQSMPAIITQIGTLLKDVTPTLWALLGGCALLMLRKPLIAILPYIRSFKAFGVELTIGPDAEKAVDAAMIHRYVNENAIDSSRLGRLGDQLKGRLQAEWTRLLGAHILWIDDKPFGNRYEARLLQRYGAVITFATSGDQARLAMRQDQMEITFDLILSNIGHASAEDRKTFLYELRKVTAAPPLIFYVARIDPGPIPEGAFALENLPDQLIGQVLNALARRERPAGGKPGASDARKNQS